MNSDDDKMVVVPSRFVSQDWLTYAATPPSQRTYGVNATGERLNSILTDTRSTPLQKRRQFLNELGHFNKAHKRNIDKPKPIALKAKQSSGSNDYKDVTKQDLTDALASVIAKTDDRNVNDIATGSNGK